MGSFGSAATEATFNASGCRSMADFLTHRSVPRAYLVDDADWASGSMLCFNVKGLRDREEAREPGSFALFLAALPASMTDLEVFSVELASLHELSALCQAIMLPSCTLQSLKLYNVRIRAAAHADPSGACLGDGSRICGADDDSGRACGADDDDDDDIRDASNRAQLIIQEALLQNTSLTRLTIDSDLCSPGGWGSILSRSDCSLTDLYLRLVAHHNLDYMLPIFTGLACNAISLTALSIAPESDHHGTPGTGTASSLESERQLATAFLTNTSLTSLSLYNLSLPIEIFGMLFDSLSNRPCCLTSLALVAYPSLPGQVVSMLLSSLEKNLSLTSLSLAYCSGEDWPSITSVLDTLRINGVLCEFEMDETPFVEDPPFEDEELVEILIAIDEQLAMNREKMLKK